MPYLEISPIEKCAEKLSKQLDNVLEAKPGMYSKTRYRYKKIAYSLLQSVEKISSILEEASLICENPSEEFEELSETESTVHIEQLSDALRNIETGMSAYSDFSSTSAVSTSEIQDSSVSNNRYILSKYREVIESSSEVDFGYYEANECAKLIHKWFVSRFINGKNHNFRYNINQLPNWICSIILLYGKYQKSNEVSKLIHIFDNWCYSVESDKNNSWAVPYEVFDIMKHKELCNFTLSAVVISDILLDKHYYLLTESDLGESSLNPSFVVSVVKKNNPALLPKLRTRLSKQSDLIEECNLVSTTGGNIFE